MNLLVGGRGAGGAPGVSPVGPSSSSVLFREAFGAREGREEQEESGRERASGGAWASESRLAWRSRTYSVSWSTALVRPQGHCAVTAAAPLSAPRPWSGPIQLISSTLQPVARPLHPAPVLSILPRHLYLAGPRRPFAPALPGSVLSD